MGISYSLTMLSVRLLHLLLCCIVIKALSLIPLHSSLSSYYILLARSRAENVLTASSAASSSGDNNQWRPLRGTLSSNSTTTITSTTVQITTNILTNINANPILAPLPQQEADLIMNVNDKQHGGDSTATVSIAASSCTNSTTDAATSTTTTTTTTAATTTVIYGIRHACSIANEYLNQKGNEWSDATFRDDLMIRDARLSDKGFVQVDKLSHRLLWELEDSDNNHWLNQVELVVVSPLTRCLQTWELGCRPALVSALEAYKKQQQLSSLMTTTQSSLSSLSLLSSPGDDPEQTESTSSTSPPRTRRNKLPLKVIVLPLATERVYTAGETGSCVQELHNEFADDTSSATKTDTLVTDWSAFDDLADNDDDDAPWWYHENDNVEKQKYNEWRPHGQGQYYAVPGEPWEIFDNRMNRFKEWLQQRPEKCILVVSHWGVFNHLTGQDVKNCGMVRMEI